MHLKFSEEEEEFREELRRFVNDSLPADWPVGFFSGFLETDEHFQFTRDFAERLSSRGWLTMSWPREYGGTEASLWLQTVLKEEMQRAGEPRGPQYMSLNYIGPAIMMFGSDLQRAEFLPRMARGELVFCQGFSEPDAGTDLASLKTKAVRSGDEYIINGEKIWTSYAHKADYCYLLARTDPDAPKHKGISAFLVPMDLPGITVRPIRSMKGWGDINSVFFDDVRVPLDSRLGEENRGWYVATASLNYERVGVARWEFTKRVLDLLVQRVNTPLPDGSIIGNDVNVRRALAEVELAYRAARILNYKVIWQVEQGESPTWEASLARVHSSLSQQKVSDVAFDVLGHFGAALDQVGSQPAATTFDEAWKKSITATISVGTIEVQKDLIATRGLGMPRG